LSEAKKNDLFEEIANQAWLRYRAEVGLSADSEVPIQRTGDRVVVTADAGETRFHLRKKIIQGPASRLSVLFKDQLRRNGVRFRFLIKDAKWSPW
jgi:hypothetical protein